MFSGWLSCNSLKCFFQQVFIEQLLLCERGRMTPWTSRFFDSSWEGGNCDLYSNDLGLTVTAFRKMCEAEGEI